MTPLHDQLAAIEARTAKATAGPWRAGPMFLPTCKVYANDCKTLVAETMTMTSCERDEDAAFIAHARTDVPALCALARAQDEALRGLIDLLRPMLPGFGYLVDVARPHITDDAATEWHAWKDKARAALAAAERLDAAGLGGEKL